MSRPKTVEGQEAMERYNKMVSKLYREPADDVIDGTFNKHVDKHVTTQKRKKLAEKSIFNQKTIPVFMISSKRSN